MDYREIRIGQTYCVADGDGVPHEVVVVRQSRDEPCWFMCRSKDLFEFIAYPDAFVCALPVRSER